MGPMKCPLRSTNKRFLLNTIPQRRPSRGQDTTQRQWGIQRPQRQSQGQDNHRDSRRDSYKDRRDRDNDRDRDSYKDRRDRDNDRDSHRDKKHQHKRASGHKRDFVPKNTVSMKDTTYLLSPDPPPTPPGGTFWGSQERPQDLVWETLF
uniref:Uncharacterized protein n=1 Tax=Hucho hucho TaxID=62062 RepID=A0A4W5P004_9TELE